MNKWALQKDVGWLAMELGEAQARINQLKFRIEQLEEIVNPSALAVHRAIEEPNSVRAMEILKGEWK